MRKTFKNLILNSHRLFLIDGLGAFLTPFFLFAIWRYFSEHIGMPKSVLELLFLVAMAFCAYSISCYFLVTKNWQPYLKAIGIANLSYCCLTLVLIFYYYSQLTFLGMVYFLMEIVVIFGLVYIEMSALKKSNQKTRM